jgi:hypothetical protein
MDDETERAYAFAARTLAHTRRIIEAEDATAWAILSAIKRHGVAVWQMGQHGQTWDWFCTLSHKAAWGDVFYKAEHEATPLQAVRDAAREWAKTRDPHEESPSTG